MATVDAVTSRRLAFAVVTFAVLVACGGGGSSKKAGSTASAPSSTTTTTTAGAACPTQFKLGEPTGADSSCYPTMLDAALRSQNVTYDHAAGPVQAGSICRRLSTSSPTSALLGVLADWETGVTPSPTPNKDDQSTFVVVAVGVYCPQFFDAIKNAR